MSRDCFRKRFDFHKIMQRTVMCIRNSYIGIERAPKTTLTRHVTTRGIVVVSDCELLSKLAFAQNLCAKPCQIRVWIHPMPKSSEKPRPAWLRVTLVSSRLLYWWRLRVRPGTLNCCKTTVLFTRARSASLFTVQVLRLPWNARVFCLRPQSSPHSP